MRRAFSASSLFLGAAAGAAAMFFLDPDQGPRRRTLLVERARRSEGRIGQRLRALGRELRGELEELKAALPERRAPNEEPLG
jgi:hypothetical protein